MSPEELDRARELFDQFRAACTGDEFKDVWLPPQLITRGDHFIRRVLDAIRDYDDFKDEAEVTHSFGRVVVDGLRIDWTIGEEPADSGMLEMVIHIVGNDRS